MLSIWVWLHVVLLSVRCSFEGVWYSLSVGVPSVKAHKDATVKKKVTTRIIENVKYRWKTFDAATRFVISFSFHSSYSSDYSMFSRASGES